MRNIKNTTTSTKTQFDMEALQRRRFVKLLPSSYKSKFEGIGNFSASDCKSIRNIEELTTMLNTSKTWNDMKKTRTASQINQNKVNRYQNNINMTSQNVKITLE